MEINDYLTYGEIRAGIRTPKILIDKPKEEINARFKRYPWIAVGLLWMVALLNYMDRQMHSPR